MKKIIKFVKNNYKLIELNKMWSWLFNQKCHINSVQQVKEQNMDTVVLCFCICNNWYTDDGFVHFINKRWEDYIDNTLWYLYKTYSYYLIKEIHPNGYSCIWYTLTDTKSSIIKECYPIMRHFKKYDI